LTGAELATALTSIGLSVDQFAERSGTHRSTVYRWIREDEIPKWAAWIVALLIERKAIADMLAR
jgi:DNA-binding transcriptional regulator YiaG